MMLLRLSTQLVESYIEPLQVFLQAQDEPGLAWLDSSVSAADSFHPNRYSYLGLKPLVTVQDPADWYAWAEPLHSQAVAGDLVGPFAGGWIGAMSYEAYDYFIPQVEPRPTRYPRFCFSCYDSFFVWDHVERNMYLCSLGLRTPDAASDATLARQRIAELQNILERPVVPQDSQPDITEIKATVTRKTYLEHLQRIQNYIHSGDCYQVNYSQEFTAQTKRSAVLLYQHLRQCSPVPFGAYLNMGGAQILSASPESYFQLEGRTIRTCPIKGTRPRGTTEAQDKHLVTDLLSSQKDRAELLMITDLARNDLGRICEAGTVQTPQLATLQSLAQVHHLYSVVEGTLRSEIQPPQLWSALFPGGSITGAPKIRSMQIIRELEPHAREVYTGSIGFVGFNGSSHFNIAIRTLIYDKGQVIFCGGGGIVADSDPELEYEESWVKTQGIREALDK